MSASTQDKTERATPKRRREARERGEVVRSRELASLAAVGAGALALVAVSASIGSGAMRWMRHALQADAALLRDPGLLPARFAEFGAAALWIVAPLLGVAVLAALLAPALLGGWNLSTQALKPDFSRADPLKGLGRMFSSQAAMELLKALLKATVLGVIATLFLYLHAADLQQIGREALQPAIAHALKLALGCLLWLCGGLLLIAMVDAPWQLWSHAKKLRMSRQEVRDEHKQSEGSPEVRARLRRAQQEIANRRMMEKLPDADVVIVNPTHFAVALQYDAAKMRAPRLIAKGRDLMAQAIRDKAREHGIPLVSAPPLARALYRGAALDQEIPAALYAAVAQILTYVYQLRRHVSGAPPAPPHIGDVPGGEPERE